MKWLVVALAACGGPSTETLRAHTQALLDAVTYGDRGVWERDVDPDIIYVSEDGTVETKASLLEQITPLPAGITGSLVIGRFAVQAHGDTAVVLHVDEETENYFGHPLHAQYLNVATWRYRGGRWRLVAQQVLASQQDPPAIALPPDELDAYAGTYALTDTIHVTIARDGDHLVATRAERKPQILRPEARDVFFSPGRPRSRTIFQRDAAGTIGGYAERREGRDVVVRRI
jgi:hypothetical protein